jgi:peptidoglycan/LPS O-acetylase OafA/YrhL
MLPRRLYEIDILRFLAALMVVFFHYTIDTHHSHKMYLTNYDFLNSAFLEGNFGVRLFFIISGFVILMSAQAVSPKKFVQARVIRLYPAFVPICIFTFFFAKAFNPYYHIGYPDFLCNVTLIGLFASWGKIQLVAGVYWTLIVEIQFYIFILILMAFKKLKFIRTFLICWLAISVLTYFGELYFDFHSIFNKLRILFITEHSYYFIGGCYFYLIKYQRKSFDIFMPMICLMMALFCFINHPNNELTYSSTGLVIVFFIIFYIISLRNIKITRNQKLYITMGTLTYPLYLIHEVLGTVIIYHLINYLNKTIVLVLTVLLIIGITYLFNVFIEMPIMSYLKKYFKGTKTLGNSKSNVSDIIIIDNSHKKSL